MIQFSWLIVPITYLIGGIPFGLIIGKLHGIDIRQHGSGNVGATNVARCCGKKWGILCFVLDFTKGLLPVSAFLIFLKFYPDSFPQWMVLIIALATVLGHIFSPFLKFKGGKGVATGAGVVLPLAPLGFFTAFIIWAIVLKLTRIMALASISGAIVLPLAVWIWSLCGITPFPSTEIFIFLLAVSVLVILRHTSNLKRIFAGQELTVDSPEIQSPNQGKK